MNDEDDHDHDRDDDDHHQLHHLVIDDVEGEDADGVDVLLVAARTKPPVVTECCKHHTASFVSFGAFVVCTFHAALFMLFFSGCSK